MNKKWFALSIDQIEKKLNTNAASGLTRKAARSRADSKDGGGLYYYRKKSVLRMLSELASDFSWIILVLAASVSLFLEELRMGLVILFFVLVNSLFSLYMYHRSRRTRESLDGFFRPSAKVIREGKLYSTDYSRVVRGDVILLESGDVILCDARLVRSEGLTVKMPVDKEQYELFVKNAEDSVSPNENNIRNVSNMVYAGSTVVEGSARAIVTDVGRYTYLGALTGGIPRGIDTSLPEELGKIKKIFSRISMLLLVAALPVCVIGLLMSNMRGGKVLLSEAFVLSVVLAASVFTQRACTVFQYFYVSFMRRSAINVSPTALRSISAFDKLGSLDVLFVLDGSLFSDGFYHLKELVRMDSSENENEPRGDLPSLPELMYMYRSSECRALSAKVSVAEKYHRGIDEYLSDNAVDETKIKIRYSELSYYISSEGGETSENVSFSDKGRKYVMRLYKTPHAISGCKGLIVNGRWRDADEGLLARLEGQCAKRMLADEKLMVVTLLDGDSEALAGVFSFAEGQDKRALQSMQELEKKGIRVIVFAQSVTVRNVPTVPKKLYRAPCVSAEDFLAKGLPVTYKFGSFSTYYGLDEEQIELIISYAKSLGKTVAVASFTELGEKGAEAADMFITSSPISSVFSGRLDEEIKSMEIGGIPTSVSCKQTLKEKAHALIPRPFGGKGGLFNLWRSVRFAELARQNLGGFFRFTLVMLFLRVIVFLAPLLMGNVILDAKHMLFFLTFIDVPVFMMLSGNTDIKFSKKHDGLFGLGFKELVKKERELMISLAAASVALFFLPYVPTFFGEQYLYNVEYYFTALTFLQLAVLHDICYGSVLKMGKALKNKWMIAITALVIVAELALFWIDSLGALMEIQSNPPIYLLLSFLPGAVFLAVRGVMRLRSKNIE